MTNPHCTNISRAGQRKTVNLLRIAYYWTFKTYTLTFQIIGQNCFTSVNDNILDEHGESVGTEWNRYTLVPNVDKLKEKSVIPVQMWQYEWTCTFQWSHCPWGENAAKTRMYVWVLVQTMKIFLVRAPFFFIFFCL